MNWFDNKVIGRIFTANLYQPTDNYDNNYIVVVSMAGTGQHYLPVYKTSRRPTDCALSVVLAQNSAAYRLKK
jgi:hypothetical protein